VTASLPLDFLAGDNDTFIGGNDVITGGAGAVNVIYGDVATISGGFLVTGGNDTLIGGVGGQNTIYGDFNFISNNADSASVISGGDDTIIGAANTMDVMYGDWFIIANTGFGTFITGADTFVIAPSGGLDAIMDFESDKDKVDLSGFGHTLDIDGSDTFEFADLDPLWVDFGDGTLTLDFDGDGDLTDDILYFNRIDYVEDTEGNVVLPFDGSEFIFEELSS